MWCLQPKTEVLGIKSDLIPLCPISRVDWPRIEPGHPRWEAHCRQPQLLAARQANVRITFVQPLLQWTGKKYFICWVCFCSLGYPACNAHAPYCHLWPVPLSCIFPHYLINDTVFRNESFEHRMWVLIFSTNSVWNISHCEQNWATCDQKCILVFMYIIRY